MSDDLISRQLVIKTLCERRCGNKPKGCPSGFCTESFAVDCIPSAQPEQQWIPCSEMLPEEDSDYFVTLKNGHVRILGYSTTQRTTYPKGFYYVENGISWRQTMNPVIAWMPLPKPWEGVEE